MIFKIAVIYHKSAVCKQATGKNILNNVYMEYVNILAKFLIFYPTTIL